MIAYVIFKNGQLISGPYFYYYLLSIFILAVLVVAGVVVAGVMIVGGVMGDGKGARITKEN